MGMTNEQLLQSITTVIVDRFDMLDGRIERLEQQVDKMDIVAQLSRQKSKIFIMN